MLLVIDLVIESSFLENCTAFQLQETGRYFCERVLIRLSLATPAEGLYFRDLELEAVEIELWYWDPPSDSEDYCCCRSCRYNRGEVTGFDILAQLEDEDDCWGV